MEFPRHKKGKQGRWLNAILLFVAPIIIIFSIRWLLFEPFVIPSESMSPNLLVHDHIIVNKFNYGIKKPIGDGWIIKLDLPQRGDIIVFRYPLNRDVFFIKRLIGLPGDVIRVQNGQITLNGQPWVIHAISDGAYNDEDDFSYFVETIPENQTQGTTEHLIKRFTNQMSMDSKEKEFIVPPKSFFVMGDNRDQSHDSRFWGIVTDKYLVGKASYVWLSCDDTIPTAPMICDPLKLRRDRMFRRIGEF